MSANFAANKDAASTLLADLNHDGNVDIVIGGAGTGNEDGLFLSSYLGDGTGHFTTGQVNALGVGTLEGEMGIGDFNEDGNIDVAFPITFPSNEEQVRPVLIFLGDGAGVSQPGNRSSSECHLTRHWQSISTATAISISPSPTGPTLHFPLCSATAAGTSILMPLCRWQCCPRPEPSG